MWEDSLGSVRLDVGGEGGRGRGGKVGGRRSYARTKMEGLAGLGWSDLKLIIRR
jgi:hypothetical protein